MISLLSLPHYEDHKTQFLIISVHSETHISSLAVFHFGSRKKNASNVARLFSNIFNGTTHGQVQAGTVPRSGLKLQDKHQCACQCIIHGLFLLRNVDIIQMKY